MEFKERIVIGAQDGRLSRRAGDYAVEHATDRRTVEYAGVDREPDDAPRVLVHHGHDSVTAKEKGLAAKQIQAPETILGMPEEC
jgi:hypothetical protein